MTATQGTSEETFRLLVDSVKDYGIFMIDPEGHIRTWNSGAEQLEGYSASEILGRHISVFYTAEDQQRNHPRHELELALAQGRYEEEGWRVRKDGTRFWANVTLTPLVDAQGVHLGFAKVTRDLTERKEAEEQLRQSEERARRMFEGVKDYAMILLDTEGRIVSWNEGARRIKGYEEREIVGRHFSTFYPEADVQMGKCEYELREAADTGRFEDENWRLRKDGTKFWASVTITAVRGSRGQLLGFTKVTRDLTDRKRAEDLLRMSYSNLEKRVHERTAQLTRANEELQAAIRTRDDFLSIASHELRTPLTPLKLQVQSLAAHVRNKHHRELDRERLARMAEACEKSVSRLGTLIDSLLDISRLNSGKFVLNREEVDLRETARELMDRYKTEIVAAGGAVELEAGAPVLGSFDRLRVEQVFVNLLTNSLKYGARQPVSISIHVDQSDAFLTFRDRGIGIPGADLSRIFEKFERAESGGGIGGMGLGLYITRQIVEAHGGEIRVESTPGRGSTFTVRLPLASAPPNVPAGH